MKLTFGLGVVLAANLTGFGSAEAASFDCNKASTSIEKLICADSRLGELDSRLAAVYKKAVSENPGLRDSQRQWITQRNSCGDTTCLADAYKKRIDELTLLSQGRGVAAANAQSPVADSSQPLAMLYAAGGYWATNDVIKRSNLSCNGLLDGSTVLKKYEPSLMTILLKLPQGIKEIRVPVTFENIKTDGRLVTFDRYEKSSNGATLGGTYQLDLSQKSLRQLKSHTCQNCAESQMRIHQKNLNGSSIVEHWCNGAY